MLRSLNSAISGLQSFQNELDVIGNNIANSNTTGFKAARVDFEDAFSQTLQMASANAANGGAVGNMQIGSGVTTAGITNLFAQGAPTRTGFGTDLYINGEGFFEVVDPASNERFVTRAGDFKVDSGGYLVTNSGYRVQGYNDSGLSATGDLMVDNSGQASPLKDFSIASDGTINVFLADGTTLVRGQVLLQRFTNPQALLKHGANLYSNMIAAGPLGGTTPQAAPPGTSGLGSLQASTLELSNVDLSTEFANLITAQRGFQANARVVTTSDEVLQELVNLKR